jgi:hypothetical protein
MARTAINPTLLTNLLATPAPGAGTLQYGPNAQAADVTNGNSCPCTGKEILIVENTSGTTAYAFTLNSVADDYGRTADLTAYSLALGDKVALPLPVRGYKQADGNAYFSATNVAVKFSVLRLP